MSLHDQGILPADDEQQSRSDKNLEEYKEFHDTTTTVAVEATEPHIAKNFRWYELVCVCFCANNVPAVIGLLLNINYTNGGIPSLVYGNLLCWTGALLAALRVAEMASVVPTVGGAYHHAIYLASPSTKAFWGWWTGIINFAGWLFNSSSTALLAGQGVVMFVQIFRDGYLVNRPTLWAISVGLFLPMLVINIWCIKYFGRIDMVCVAAQVLGITSILIALLAINSPLAPAADVFVNVVRSDPGNSLGNSLMLGFFTGATLASGLDGGAHLAEEVKSPRRVIPKIILAVVSSGLVCSVLYAILYGFASTDIETLLTSQSYFPVVILVKGVLNSPGGAVIFNLIITGVAFIGAMGSLLIASRQLMSLAQDGVVPHSWRLHVVHSRLRLPVNALLAVAAISCITNLIYLSGTAGWNAVNALCVVSFNISYATVLALGIWRGRDYLPEDRAFKLPKTIGRIVDIGGLGYELFSMVVLFYPGGLPMDITNFNWGLVAELAFLALIVVSWYTYGKYHYKVVDLDKLVAIVDHRDQTEETTH